MQTSTYPSIDFVLTLYYPIRMKHQTAPITIRLYSESLRYFKRLSVKSGIRYQTLINLVLLDASRRSVSPIPHWQAVQSHAESLSPLVIDSSITDPPKQSPTILPPKREPTDKPKPTVRDAARLMSAELRALSNLPDDDETNE